MNWPTDDEYLNRLLGIYWLRPETALTRAEDCAFVRDYCADILRGENIELGCGNGLLSFIMAGGVIDENYDAFLDVDHPELYSTTSIDMFDKISDRLIKYQDDGLLYSYELAMDWKEGLLSQAGRYKKLYKDLRLANLNNDVKLEKTYDTIFCNMLYWLDNPEKALKNWADFLKPHGHVILFCTNNRFKDCAWMYYKAPHQGMHAYLNYFDRGYGGMYFKDYSDAEWNEAFSNAGYSVVEKVNARSDSMMEIWNIGTRPIASPIMLMAEKLKNEDRLEIKKYWVEFFAKFFMPVIEDSLNKRNTEIGSYYFYVLEKK